MDHGGQPDRATMQIKERVKNLERYLQELALIPAIKESEQFKLFLQINQKCPEISENFRSSLIPKDFENNSIRPSIQQDNSSGVNYASISHEDRHLMGENMPRDQNFKIIGELFSQG